MLTLAQASLVILVLVGLFQRESWGRLSTILVGIGCGAFCYAVRELHLHTGRPEALLWARLIVGLGVILITVAHVFALTLGRADPKGSIRSARVFIISQGVVGICFLLAIGSNSFVSGFVFSEGSWVIQLGPIGRIYLGFLLLGLAAVAFRLECTCRSIRGGSRWRLLWAALGIFACSGYFAYLLTDGAMSGIVERDALVASGLPILIASALVAVAQIGRDPSAEVTIGRQVIYKSLTGAVTAAYLVTVLAAGYLAQLIGLRPAHLAAGTLFATTTAGLVIFLFSRTLRRRMLGFIDRNFSPGQVDYRTYWLRASHELVSGVGAHALQERASILFEDLFDAGTVTIHLARRAGDPFRTMHTNAAGDPPDVEMGEPIVRLLDANPEPILLQGPADRLSRTADPALLPTYVENELFLEATEARVVAPLKTAERLIGFVTLGPRKTGERYTWEDLALLETVTLQLAGAIRGAWLSEDLGAARDMEVFSQWANVVLHDLKNFVSPLKLFLQNARRHMHNPEFREQAIDDIQAVVEKMDTEIHRLTALRHGEEISPVATDLHWVLDSALTRHGLESLSNFSLDRRYSRLPAVTADPAQIDRVFANLITNAIESMPNGGLLSVITEEARDEATGARWAVVRVRDTGSGMAPSFLRNRLFQPFATTKKKGWGLGLYQCRQIVEAHGGTLTATSQEGIGSEFKVTLPLRQAAQPGTSMVGPGAVATGRPTRQS